MKYYYHLPGRPRIRWGVERTLAIIGTGGPVKMSLAPPLDPL